MSSKFKFTRKAKKGIPSKDELLSLARSIDKDAFGSARVIVDLPDPPSPPINSEIMSPDIPNVSDRPIIERNFHPDLPTLSEKTIPEVPKPLDIPAVSDLRQGQNPSTITDIPTVSDRKINPDEPPHIPEIPQIIPGARPWKKTFLFDQSSLDSGINGAEISPNDFQTLLHAILDNGVIEKAPGRTQLGTQLESGVRIDGVFRSWDKAGNKVALCAVNGKIKRWTGSAWSDVLTGLTATIPYSFQNANDRTLIANGYDDAREFSPSDNSIRKLGLEPPRFYRPVAYFETGQTITQVTATAAQDTTVYDSLERTGASKASLRLTASGAGLTPEGWVVPASTNLSIFPNGATITDNDLLSLKIFHQTWAKISNIQIDFWTSAGNYYRLQIDPAELDYPNFRNSQWTSLAVRRSRVTTTGSPNWNSIARVYFRFTSVTGGTFVSLDNVFFKNAVIEAVPYRVDIEDFEGTLPSASAGTISNNSDRRYLWRGTKSAKWVGSADANLTKNFGTAVNLAQYSDGVTSQTSDEVCLRVHCPTTANLTKMTVYLYNDVGETNGYSKEFLVAVFNQTSSGAWTDLRAKKSAFSDVLTPTGWNSILRMKIAIDLSAAVSTTLYFDDFRMEEPGLTKSIATMENSEAWTWEEAGSGDFTTDPLGVSRGTYALYLDVPKNQTYSVSYILPAKLDLTIFGAGEASGTDDFISFRVAWTVFSTIKEIEIRLDCSDATPDYGTDYYSYKISPDKLLAILNLTGAKAGKTRNQGVNIDIKKSDFTRVGTSANAWDDIYGVRFLVSTGKGIKTTVYFDDLNLRRSTGLLGLYQFCELFFRPNPNIPGGMEYSAPSEWSEQVALSGTKGFLKYLTASKDTEAAGIIIFRKGGSLGIDAKLDTTIWVPDWTTMDTTTQVELDDSLTGRLLNAEDIPSGTIRVPLGAVWGPKFRGSYTLYRDPSQLRRLYFSNPGYPNAWSELQAVDFESDILDCFVEDDVYFVNTKNGIKRIRIPLKGASIGSWEETGLVKHSMGPYASTQAEDGQAVVSYDGVYLFSGYAYQYISEKVKNFFDPATYDLDSAIIFYRRRHLYVAVRTTGGTCTLLDFYLPRKAWRTSGYDVNCFCVWDGPGDNQELYIGDRSGNVYQLDTSYASTSSIVTADMPASDDPFEEVTLHTLSIIARSASSTPGNLNIQFRIDQVLNATITKAATLSTAYALTRFQLRAVSDYLKGSKIGLSIAPSVTDKHFAIQAIQLTGEIAPSIKQYEEG